MATNSKYPWIKFYTGDWLKDPELSMCGPATRAIWFDMLCAMHERGQTGELTGTPAQLARLCRCDSQEMLAALDELGQTGTADVSFDNECNETSTRLCANVTIINRRMKQEAEKRKSNKNRVLRHREKKKQECNTECNASVMPQKSEVRSHKEKEKKKAPLKNQNNEAGEGVPQPMLSQVEKYFTERKYSSDPRHFFEYYSVKGWNGPSWSVLADAWERRELNFSRGSQKKPPTKVCLFCGSCGSKYQCDERGNQKWLCEKCHKAFVSAGPKSWGGLSEENIKELIKRSNSNE